MVHSFLQDDDGMILGGLVLESSGSGFAFFYCYFFLFSSPKLLGDIVYSGQRVPLAISGPQKQQQVIGAYCLWIHESCSLNR